MQTFPGVAPYTGPRPSPARRWFPFVMVVSAAAALGNGAQLVLNLNERRLQVQRKSAHPPSSATIRRAISAIHTVSGLTTAAVVAFVIVGLIWEFRRRNRSRVARDGESGVEMRLRTVWPSCYVLFFAMIGLSIVTSSLASGTTHTGMSIDDFVRFRTYLAAGAAARMVSWFAFIALAARATSIQDHREAIAAP